MAAFAQGRHHQRIHAETMIEIGAIAPGAHLLDQIPIGGRDDAHVDLVLAVRTDPLQLSALQYPQQFGLHRQRQFPHLIQKQRAAVRQLKLAAPLADRARKCAAHVAEQFAFDQRFRQRRAIQTDHRLARARRSGMNGVGHQLLADPGFAADQHRHVARPCQPDFIHQALMRRALPQQLAATQIGGQAIGFRAPAFLLAAGRQLPDALGHIHRRRRQSREGLQRSQIDAVETMRAERVQRQHAPRPAADRNRASHAIVHFQAADVRLHQAIIGIGQRRIRREARRRGAFQQNPQTRMRIDLEAPPQRIVAQTVDRQRNQRFALQPQQRGRIAGEKRTQRIEQAAVAFALAEIVRKVGDQWNQGVEQDGIGHGGSESKIHEQDRKRVNMTWSFRLHRFITH